jgi:hypothetical protein
MFKKPFNKVTGEIRECKICKEQFHTHKPVWRCKPCIGKANFESAKKKYGEKGLVPTGKWAGMEPKKPYPFNTATQEANRRFNSIRTKLSNAWKQYNKTGDKSVIIAHYDKQLEEIKDNGIMEWILDRRSDDAKKDQSKSKTRTHIEYPNTRDMPYD